MSIWKSQRVTIPVSQSLPVSWHDNHIDGYVEIPENQNAFSFGPEITISDDATVVVPDNSVWSVFNP